MEKAKARANEPKPLPQQVTNLKSGCSPLIIKNYEIRHKNTSTPQKFFANLDISSIHHAITDESVVNLVETEKSNHTETNAHQVQPAFVAKRKINRVLTGQLSRDELPFSPIERKQSIKTDDKIVDDAAASIISVMDISSIAEWHDNMEMDKTTESNDSFALPKPRTSEMATEEKHNKTDNIPNKTEVCSLMDSFEIPVSPKSNSSSSSLDSASNQPITVSVEVHQEDAAIETISVSSTSITTTLSSSSAPITTANEAKLSIKPHVGFDASNSIYELSMLSKHNESSQKLVMKGGKWRRTVFESRKNKVTQCKSNCSASGSCQ